MSSAHWLYTKDGRTKIGPISSTQLQSLARSGQLAPGDMVCQQGTTQWLPANTVKRLFTRLAKKNPTEIRRTVVEVKAKAAEFELAEPDLDEEEDDNDSAAASGLRLEAIGVGQWCLGISVGLTLFAAAFGVLRIGGDVLPPVFAAIAILAASGAVVFAASRAVVGSAATAVFLSVATMFFAIGASVLERTIAKAGDVDEERKKVDIQRAEARKARDDAKELMDRAEKEP